MWIWQTGQIFHVWMTNVIVAEDYTWPWKGSYFYSNRYKENTNTVQKMQ